MPKSIIANNFLIHTIFLFLDSMQPPENHVAMMQIDCEVMNTRLLHIHQDSIPAHANHAMRADYSKSKRLVYKNSLVHCQHI